MWNRWGSVANTHLREPEGVGWSGKDAVPPVNVRTGDGPTKAKPNPPVCARFTAGSLRNSPILTVPAGEREN